ncbi:ABC transporter ATP-binding protein/permease [Paraburkholderia phenazinium]|uniref:ATP-binding cassette, subfamily C, CydCD n=1 Tax=Paraburkholderia phenazinium TaxID=60549 RepID=A0A1G8JH77_9BURK|nr:ABC transporter ATP-binding protein [Paraburkholderia phenazinium]SDI29980.1 ATP-binding cassette, subfamily C, CydCD [Paraburkholderia phenazinium]
MEIKLVKLIGRLGVRTNVALGVAVSAGYVLQGVLLAFALTEIYQGGGTIDTIRWIAAAAAAVAVRCALVWAAEVAAQRTARNVRRQLRERLLQKLFDLGPGFAARSKAGDLQSTIVGGVEALEVYYSGYVPAVFIALISCTGVVLCLAYFDWRAALLLAVFVVALPVVDRLWLRWRMPKSSGVFAALGEFGAYLLDSLQGIATLKAFGASAIRRDSLAKRAAELRRESMATLSVTLARTGLTALVSLGGFAIVVGAVAWRASAGEVGSLVVLATLFLAREAFRPLERLEKSLHAAWAAGGAAAPIMALLAEVPSVQEPAAPMPAPARADIVFDSVSFTYPGSDAPALNSTSFSVPERGFVALVGPSGAGKSTVAALLLRFFDPQAGSIRVGGIDIRKLSSGDLRDLISVVPQETYLFHGTIEDNLRIAKPDATSEEIRAVAKAAHIDAFIESLPQGYATEVGERGAQMSGGQRQRIAIARALLKDTPILLLDEATSNVDPASEKAIQQALAEQARQRTTVVIAHRMSTIRDADSILVLEDGTVREAGRHADLAQRGGLYSRLVHANGELV